MKTYHHTENWKDWWDDVVGNLRGHDGCHFFPDGSCLSFENGVFHREDGPAIIYTKEPFVRNDRHFGYRAWYLKGIHYETLDEWAKKMGIHGTDEHTMLKLKYG